MRSLWVTQLTGSPSTRRAARSPRTSSCSFQHRSDRLQAASSSRSNLPRASSLFAMSAPAGARNNGGSKVVSASGTSAKRCDARDISDDTTCRKSAPSRSASSRSAISPSRILVPLTIILPALIRSSSARMICAAMGIVFWRPSGTPDRSGVDRQNAFNRLVALRPGIRSPCSTGSGYPVCSI